MGRHAVSSVHISASDASIRRLGKRGHIISEFRNQTSKSPTTSPPILAARPGQGSPQPPYSPISPAVGRDGGEPISPASSFIPQYNKAFFLNLIPDYVEGVYPVQPVIAEYELRQYIEVMDTDQDVRSFIYAFGGCTLNLTRYGSRRTAEIVQTIEDLMNHSIDSMRRAHKQCHFSVMRAMQSMFIHNCLMSINGPDAAFYYIRDAISVIQLLRIDNPENAAKLLPSERSRRQRLYWQAYIHERFLAILDYRQAILPPLYTLPEDDPTLPIQVHEGFTQIIKLFQMLDPEFLDSWLDPKGGGVTSTWVEAKSRELEGDPEADARELALLSMMQRADLIITREWLRTLVWRLAMSQTLLSTQSSKECLSLLFPVRLSQTLRQQVSSMSRHDIEVHGSSITQKLFEITDTIADVLIHVPAATLAETALRIDDFLFILDFVLLFPHLDQTRRGILLEKLERLQTMFPAVLSNASSPNLPLELQSPGGGTDPWCHVAQSKTAAGREGLTEGVATRQMQIQTQSQEVPRSEARNGKLATWNDISKRLSMQVATFGHV
ncbi:C6 transcription factor [Pyrenophora seminiperda CCB06]|uniref:C6 transcription factor n=1 Tax=Pyrenophora seminiperda CCB06 TaxID=1302712 RepID=A0A3M7MI76_9PLEO|nr:C6 transcription factor [Pyrenophora seminiperda CCB06]